MDERSRVSVSDDYRNGFEPLEEDRISEMPDAILVHILSFLSTEDAIKTGALSRRWLYVWTWLPELSFYEECSSCETLQADEDCDHIDRFVNFVNQTLMFHACSKIRKFVLRFAYDSSLADSVDMWVRYATKANVEKLSLNLYNDYDDNYELPQHVYKQSSIKKLSLEKCTIDPSESVSWKSLKSLSIRETSLDEDAVQNILAGSPVLEYLELEGFSGFDRLHIGLANLRELVLTDSDVGEELLEISAPNLQSLIIEGDMHDKTIRIMDMKYLVNCKLRFYQDLMESEVHRNTVKQLLHGIAVVKKLTLGNWVLQILAVLELEKDALSRPLSNCQSLELEYAKEGDLSGVAILLQNTPSLERLVISMTEPSIVECTNYEFPKEYWISRKECFTYSLQHLKTVKIVGSIEQHCGFELVKFLFEKATVLEKMVLEAHQSSWEELVELAFKLSTVPKSSPGAVVTFAE